MHNVTEPLVHAIVHFAMRSVVELPLIVLAAWCANWLLAPAGSRLQHRLWASTLLLCVAVPMFPVTGWQVIGKSAHSADTGAWVRAAMSASSTVRPRLSLSPLALDLIAIAYMLMVMLRGLQLAVQWRRTRLLHRQAVECELSGSARMSLAQAAARAQIAVPPLLISDHIAGPLTMGSFSPVLLLPAEFFDTQTEDEIAAALAHECAHIARRDYAVNLLYQLVALPLSFHPAVWAVQRRIAQTRELVCDQQAAECLGDRHTYAASLLGMASSMAARQAALTINAIGVFDANILEERIMRLHAQQPVVSRARQMIISALALAMMTIATLGAHAVGVQTQSQVDDRVYTPAEGATAPVLIYAVDAVYPKSATDQDQPRHVVVVVAFVVSSNGALRDVHVERSSAPDFDRSALDAVRQDRFRPGTFKGKPVAVRVKMEVEFNKY